MGRIMILMMTLSLLSSCSNQNKLTVQDTEQFEFVIMESTVEEIVNSGYEICTTYGVPYLNLDQHVIEKKKWSYFDLYKDNKYISRIGVLNDSLGPQALKDGVLVFLSMNEESIDFDFVIVGQEISSITKDSLSQFYPKFKFKEIDNRNEGRTSFETQNNKVALTYSFDKEGKVVSVTLRSLGIDF